MQRASGRNEGFMLILTLLMVLTVGILVWLQYGGRTVDKETLLAQSAEPEKYPWVEKGLLLREGETPEKPYKSQPQIAGEMLFRSRPTSDEGLDMGVLLFLLKPDGLIEAEWSGTFNQRQPRMEFQIMNCAMLGNICPEKTCEDAGGGSGDKLYLAAAGSFTLLESNDDSGKVRTVKGDSYITGWLDKDNNVEGYLTITSDMENCKVYPYKAKKIDPKSLQQF